MMRISYGVDGSGSQSDENEASPAPVWHFASFAFAILSITLFAANGSKLFAFANLNKSPTRLFAAVIALNLLLTAYTIWGFHLRGNSGRLIGDEGETSQSRTGDVLLGIALGVALLVVSIVLGAMFPGGRRNIAPELAVTGFDHMAELVAYLVASVCEEIQYRGYCLQQLVALTRSTGAAIVIQALLFVLIHGSGQGISGYLTRLVFGVAFGLIVVIRKSLWPSITAHILINLAAFFVGLW